MEKTVSTAVMEAVRGLGATPRGGRLRNQLQSRAPSPPAPCGEDASEEGAERRPCEGTPPCPSPALGISPSASSCRAPLSQRLCCLQRSGNHGCPPLCDAKQLSCPQLPQALPPAGPGSQKTPAGLVIRTGHLQRDFTRRVLAGTDGALCWGDLRRI